MGTPYTYDVDAADPDGDELTYQLKFGDFAGLQDIGASQTGDVFVVDDRAFGGIGGIFQIDPVTGTQTVITSNANLVGPTGMDVQADGTLVVVDPFAFGGLAGVIQVDPTTGTQTTISLGDNLVFPTGCITSEW